MNQVHTFTAPHCLKCGMSLSLHAFNGTEPKKCLYGVGFFQPICCQRCGCDIVFRENDGVVAKKARDTFRACGRCR